MMTILNRATALVNQQYYLSQVAELREQISLLESQAEYWRQVYDTWHEKNTLQSQTPDA